MTRWFMTVAIGCLLAGGCNVKREDLKEILYWNNKTIHFDAGLELKVEGRDTLIPGYPDKEYKILVYAGPRGCSSCQLNLYAWQHLIDSLQNTYPNLDVVFVANVPDFRELETLAKMNKFRLPIFYDRKGTFTERNKFPVEKTVQVLLLDKNNKVVLIGNPIKQGKVLVAYRKIISGVS